MLKIIDSIPKLQALRAKAEPSAVKTNKLTRIYEGFNTVEKRILEVRRFDGSFQPRQLEYVLKTPGVAVIPLDIKNNSVVLIEEFRIGAYLNDLLDSWQLEVPAGLMDPGETPLDTAKRELYEETGLVTCDIKPALEFYSSPGFNSEKLYGFVANVDAAKLARHAGIDDEDIQCFAVSLKLIRPLLEINAVKNGISLTMLQWLALNYD